MVVLKEFVKAEKLADVKVHRWDNKLAAKMDLNSVGKTVDDLVDKWAYGRVSYSVALKEICSVVRREF